MKMQWVDSDITEAYETVKTFVVVVRGDETFRITVRRSLSPDAKPPFSARYEKYEDDEKGGGAWVKHTAAYVRDDTADGAAWQARCSLLIHNPKVPTAKAPKKTPTKRTAKKAA